VSAIVIVDVRVGQRIADALRPDVVVIVVLHGNQTVQVVILISRDRTECLNGPAQTADSSCRQFPPPSISR
jgi:hypothetical protein